MDGDDKKLSSIEQLTEGKKSWELTTAMDLPLSLRSHRAVTISNIVYLTGQIRKHIDNGILYCIFFIIEPPMPHSFFSGKLAKVSRNFNKVFGLFCSFIFLQLSIHPRQANRSTRYSHCMLTLSIVTIPIVQITWQDQFLRFIIG